MPAYVTARIADELNEQGRSLKGSRILALGVTYKPDVGDVRESAAIHVMERLARKGADVTFHDPFIEVVEEGDLRVERVELDQAALEAADLVVLLTPHAAYDLDWVAEHAARVFDARNAFGAARDNVSVL
jgi:UDP-N-acetyl-D-glucosamine dehydrogenase